MRKPTFKRGVAFMQTYKLVEEDPVLLSQPLLIEHFGRAGAQFLSQLHYWLEHPKCGQQHQGQKWIYNTENSWADQLKLSVRQFRRHVSHLSHKGIIFVQKLNPHKSNRTNYFSINYVLLDELLKKNNSSSILGIPPENRTFVHQDKMSSSSGQNVLVYNDTKTTNKDINKSEEVSIKQTGQGGIKRNQVERVNNIKNRKLLKVEETKQDNHEKAYERQNSTHPKIVAETATSKTSTVQDMLAIWNKTLGEKTKVIMSKDLAPLLVSAYSKKFEQNLEQWKRYCEQIKSSSYLTGEVFQLSIFWALKFRVIDRIRAGEFGVKLNIVEQGTRENPILDEGQIRVLIERLEEPNQAKILRHQIATAIGAAAYYSWFHHAKLETRHGEIQLKAPNSFVEQVWETQFPWVMKEK